MGIHDKKSAAEATGLPKKPQPADRDYVARVQQRIERLTEAVDNQTLSPIGAKFAERHRQYSEQQMAQLRSEAVQARRLAEHIESLSRRTPQGTRNRTMTESSIFDPEPSQPPQPGIKKKPAATSRGGALSFNPVHPSQELPPEQLIRLLGMESKKSRNHLKKLNSSRKQQPRPAVVEERIQRSEKPPKPERASEEQKPQSSQDLRQSKRSVEEPRTRRPPAADKPVGREQGPEPQQEVRPRHPLEYERNEPAVFEQRGPGWFLPSLVIGLVAGAVVSATLFWFKSPTTPKQVTPAAEATSEPRKQRIPKQQPTNRQVTRKATPGVAPPPPAPAKAAVKTPAKTPASENDARWQAAVNSEQKRLRRAAEQRLAEQLTQISVRSELADTPPADDGASAAAAAQLPMTRETSADQTAISDPAMTETLSTPTRETAVVEIPAPHTLADEATEEEVEAGLEGELDGESSEFVDRVEAPSESVTAPALEVNATTNPTEGPDSVSDTDPEGAADLEATQASSAVVDEGSSSVAADAVTLGEPESF